MPDSQPQEAQPPKPPEFGRELELKKSQLIGLVSLALIVILAIFGLFGQSSSQTTSEGERLALEVTYPSRFRFKMADSIDVQVTNLESDPVQGVVIRFDRDYVDRFSAVQFTPSLDTITGDVYEVTLGDLAPGKAKSVSVDVQAEEYWRHRGFIEAEAGGDGVRVDLSTFVFP